MSFTELICIITIRYLLLYLHRVLLNGRLALVHVLRLVYFTGLGLFVNWTFDLWGELYNSSWHWHVRAQIGSPVWLLKCSRPAWLTTIVRSKCSYVSYMISMFFTVLQHDFLTRDKCVVFAAKCYSYSTFIWPTENRHTWYTTMNRSTYSTVIHTVLFLSLGSMLSWWNVSWKR